MRAAADARRLVLLALALLVVRVGLDRALGLELHFDEAQYWEWSQQLDWSYYSKGPLVAWLIALSTGALGHGEWQVRLPAWLAFDAFLVLLFLFARDVWQSRRAAWWAFALGLTCPLYWTLGHVMTTDVLLLACWTWGLWAAYRAIHHDERRAWYECGLAVGIGALTKLSILLLPAALAVAVLRDRMAGARRPLPPGGALALALAIASPVVIWNATHDWPMFRHNAAHVGGLDLGHGKVLEFLLSQWLLLSPIVAPLAAWSLARVPADAGRRLVWGVSLGVLGVLVARSVIGKAQANWAAPAYVGFVVLFAGAVSELPAVRRRILVAGMALTAGLMVALLVRDLPTSSIAALREVTGWRQPIQELARRAPGAEFILTPTYQLAAELAFYWPWRLPVYVVGDPGRRHNQHDIWPGPAREAGRTGLFVSTGPPPPELARAFARCQGVPPVIGVARDGVPVRAFVAHLCEDYRPIDWSAPRRY